jgi:hypothetical protein
MSFQAPGQYNTHDLFLSRQNSRLPIFSPHNSLLRDMLGRSSITRISSSLRNARFASGVSTETTSAAKYSDSDAVYSSVTDYYGKVLSSSADLKTNACTTSSRPAQVIIDALNRVPTEITERYYGCGTPLPLGIEGLDVLDLVSSPFF